MISKQWGMRLALVGMLFVGTLACRTEELFVSQQPSATPTRTPRPTFTPLPSPTAIATIPVIPTEVSVPTEAPAVATKAPTRTPTKRPTARPATPRPPTQPPVVVAPTQAPPPPTAVPVQQYTYQATGVTCTHAGQAFIKGAVYNDKNDLNSKTSGIKVAMGAGDGSTIWVQVKTDQYGEYTFTLNANGAKPGAYWVWVIDDQGNRISQIGGPVNMNDLNENDPNSCWFGSVDFYK